MNSEPMLSPKKEKMLSFKRNRFYTALVALSFVVGVLVGYFIRGASSPASAPAEAADIIDQTTSQRYEIPTEGFPSVGPQDAEIVLVEFSDFGCSFCAKWHNETYEDLMAAYPGQIRFVYRDVPFRAFPASEAARCAREQDAFWEYHDKLFSYEYSLNNEAYIQYAEDLNLDMAAFNTCLNEHRYREIIQQDLDAATQLGISSTPTFFINGLPLIGAQPLAAFRQLIDRELAGEIDY
ncbi:MAG: DsbA family protein [Anaerolineales bacterium]|nr:DsbA family protein [Anaerolineales bacterium]